MNENENLVPKRRFKEFINTGTWEQRKLEDLGSFKNGMNFDKSAMGHGHPFINLQNIFGKTVVDDKDLGLAVSSEKQRNEYNLLKGDILFIRSSVKPEGVGEAALVPKNFENTTFSGFIIRFRPHITIDDEFKRVIFATKTVRNQIMALATSSANTNINQISLGKIIIELPELSEQSKIGNLFKQLDNAIALHQRKLEKSKALKSAYLSEMFPAEGERKPKRRFAGFTDDWEQRKLMETNTSFTDGNYGESYPSGNDMSDSRNGVPFLRGSNLKNGKLDNSGANYITLEKHKELTSGHLVYDDIVIAVRGSLGALGYVDIDNVDWNINSQLAIIRTDKSELNGAFVIQFLSSNKGQKELLSRQTGTALKQLPIKQLQDVPVPKPELAEQNKISEFFRQLDDTIALHQHKLEKLKNIKQAYLNELFV